MQLPSNSLHDAFSEIDVNEIEDGGVKRLEISYSAMVGLSGKDSEGWETGIAVDASVSMMDAYGRGLEGSVPEDVKKRFESKGWIHTRTHDGGTVHYWLDEAYKDAIKQGYLSPTPNIVEPEARKFSSYLAERLDEDGGTDIIYWAAGEAGTEIEEFGELEADACRSMKFEGPQRHAFGQKTHLLPAVKYFEQKYRSARSGLFVFITDGKLDDLEDVKKFTVTLAKTIEAKKRNPFKASLIGIGSEIDENQMEALDDLDTGTDVDIWDHKIAAEMKDIMEIFAELVDENTTIGPSGEILDADGNSVKKFNDGVPARGSFTLPMGSEFFVFKVGTTEIKQSIRG